MLNRKPHQKSLLDRVGGTQGVAKVAQLLYAAVVTDDLLSEYFDGCDVLDVEKRQTRFLTSLLAGPQNHAAKGAKDSTTSAKLLAAHSPLVKRGLGDEHFDRLLELMDLSLAESGIDMPTRVDVRLHLNYQRGAVLGTNPEPKQEQHMIFRIAGMTYAVVCYLAGMVSLLYIAGWLIGVGVPTPLDAPATTDFEIALLVNLSLVVMFGLQHSVMARPWFKAQWTKLIPEPLERATYVLCSSIAMIAMMWFWQPLGIEIWHLTGNAAYAMYALYAAGWLILVGATFCLNHFELFGLRQAWLYLRGLSYTPLSFATPGMYQWVRHPIYVGWFVLIWAAPVMTISHLVFALAVSAYTFMAIPLEERDLSEMLPEYEDYKKRVPALLPRLRSKG